VAGPTTGTPTSHLPSPTASSDPGAAGASCS
jgi:hypothetical protein